MKKRKIAEFYIHFLNKHKILITLIVIVLTLSAAYLTSKIKYSTSITDLLPPENKKVSDYLYTLNNLGLTDNVIVSVSAADKNADSDDISLYSEIFIENLKSHKEFNSLISSVDYNIEQKLNIVFTPFFLKNIWVLAPTNKLPALLNILKYNQMEEIISQNRKLIQTGSGMDAFLEKDPLHLLNFFKSYTGEMKGKLKIKLINGNYFTEDGKTQIFFLKTKQNADNLVYTEKLMNFLFKVKLQTDKDYLEETETEKPNVNTGFTGPHPITYYDKDIAQNDMFSTLWISFLLVIVIFVFGFKNPFSFFYAAIPLVLGELWTFALTYLFVGRINILTSITGAILVGLGIDFAIHLYSRFLEEEVKQKDKLTALVTTMGETGGATISGALTTAAAFATMSLSSFKGLKEFGIIASLGIVATLIACLVVIPLLILFRKNVFKPKKLPGFGTVFFHKIVDNYYKQVVLGGLLIFTVFVFFASQLRFTTSLRDLRSKTNPALKLQTLLTEKLGGSLRPLIIVLKGNNQQDLEKQFNSLSKILQTKRVARIESIFSFIPPTEKQRENIEFLKSATIPQNISDNFISILEKQGFVVNDYQKMYITSIEKGLKNPKVITFEEIIDSNIYGLLKNYIRQTEKGFELIVKVYPEEGLWNKKFTSQMVSTVENFFEKTKDNGSFITGIDVVINEIKSLVKENFFISSVIAFFLVLGIVFLHFKNPYHTLLAFIPLISGIAIMLGGLHLSGDDISLYNFIATPMIIGIGIDSGIHILSRVLNSENNDVADAVIHTGKAITFTSLTTVVGFGSLFLSHFEGFKSLGFSTILGVGACWAASLIFFPALLKILLRKKQ